jgi:hypothetical protein
MLTNTICWVVKKKHFSQDQIMQLFEQRFIHLLSFDHWHPMPNWDLLQFDRNDVVQN